MKIFLIFLILNSVPIYSKDYNFNSELRISNRTIIKKYDKILKVYKKKLCTPGLEKKYDELFSDYQGNGVYVPYLDDQVDTKTIRNNLFLLKSKKRWIHNKRVRLAKYFRLPALESDLEKLSSLIDKNLEIKYLFDVQNQKTPEIIAKGKKTFLELRNFYKKFEQKFFYLHNFKYPVDHLANRKEYEEAKSKNDKLAINSTYFRRKIFEDGAPSSSRYKKDTFTRTIIDTIKIEVSKDQVFINNSLLYDLDWLSSTLVKAHSNGLQHYKTSFETWGEQVDESLKFYQEIIGSKKQDRIFASTKLEATEEIKKFVNSRLAMSYDYWSKKKEIYQSLFSLETILFNEVGSLDPSGNERKEVIDVVLNRFHNPLYNQLDPEQDLKKYLVTNDFEKNRWLNLFYKEREFSFTYFFIPAVVNIFCPPRTKWAKQLRESNLELSLDGLRNYEKKGKNEQAIRYFSRASMVGRIDMATIWHGHRQLPESLGTKVTDRKDEILRALANKEFQYRYTFNRDNKNYSVYNVSGEKYAVWHGNKETEIYSYRDPHFFRFFSI